MKRQIDQAVSEVKKALEGMVDPPPLNKVPPDKQERERKRFYDARRQLFADVRKFFRI